MKNLLIQKPWITACLIALICFSIGYCGNFHKAVQNSSNEAYKDTLGMLQQKVKLAKEELQIAAFLDQKLQSKADYLNKYIFFKQEELMDMCPKTYYNVSNKRRY